MMHNIWRSHQLAALVALVLLTTLAACDKDDPVNPPPGGSTDTLPSRSGLALYLPFNGSVTDSSGNNIPLTIENTALDSNRFGQAGRALRSNGNNSMIYALLPSAMRFTDAISIAAWVKMDQLKTGTIIRRGQSGQITPWTLGVSGIGGIVFMVNSVQGINHLGYSLNTWTFVVATYDRSYLKMYVDGVLTDSVAYTDPIADTPDPVYIGTRLKLPADTFGGMIDDLALYSRVLSRQEVQALYQLKKQ